MLIFALIVGLVQLWLARAAYKHSPAILLAFLGILFCTVSIQLYSFVLIVQAIMLTFLVFVCLFLKPSSPLFKRVSFGVSVMVFAIVGLHATWQTYDGRQRYPLVSLDGRLAYEDKWNLAKPNPKWVPESYETADELDQGYFYSYERKRNSALSLLHRSAVGYFVNADGFGVGRMKPSIENPWLEPAPVPIAQDAYMGPSAESSDRSVSRSAVAWTLVPQHNNAMTEYHTDTLLDFFFVPRMGYVIDRSRVAGFEPHALGNGHFSREPDGFTRTANIQLVSMLKFEKPMVYLSEYLPRMDQLRAAPVRDLDSFETAATEKLQAGEEIVIDGYGQRVRMLGAIRASGHCLHCHSVPKGHLLGAFSYDLRH